MLTQGKLTEDTVKKKSITRIVLLLSIMQVILNHFNKQINTIYLQ